MVYVFILAGIILRLVPHPPNFAPIAALALFGGTYLNKKEAIAIPLIAMLIGDFFKGFYSHWLMLAVYGTFILIVLLGIWLKKHKSLTNVAGASLIGSILFFVITNFAVWAVPHSFYPHTWQGLSQSYIMGLPFFKNTFLGDMFYVGAIFGLYEIVLFVSRNYSFKKEADGRIFFGKMERKRI